MNREAKEQEVRRIFQGFTGSADVSIFCHALSIYGGTGSLAEQVTALDAEEFETFYADCMENWCPAAPMKDAQP